MKILLKSFIASLITLILFLSFGVGCWWGTRDCKVVKTEQVELSEQEKICEYIYVNSRNIHKLLEKINALEKYFGIKYNKGKIEMIENELYYEAIVVAQPYYEEADE